MLAAIAFIAWLLSASLAQSALASGDLKILAAKLVVSPAPLGAPKNQAMGLTTAVADQSGILTAQALWEPVPDGARPYNPDYVRNVRLSAPTCDSQFDVARGCGR